MLDLDLRRSSEIPIRVVAAPKREALDALVVLVVCRAVVQKATDGSSLYSISSALYQITYLAYPSAIRINGQCKSIKLANSVDTRRANLVLAILYIPKLEVTTPSFFTICSEFKIRRPFRLGGPRTG